MREIKFRAKARFSGTIGSDKWIYSSLMRLDATTHRLNLGGLDCDIDTLGQFIGLTDENGKDIYEGDRVQDEHTGTVGIVVFEEGSFDCGNAFEYKGFVELCLRKRIKVIGNIHETPELLAGTL